jgi:hypothetical protein
MHFDRVAGGGMHGGHHLPFPKGGREGGLFDFGEIFEMF